MDCVQGMVWLPRALFPFLDARFGLSLVETRLLGLGFHHSLPLRPPPPPTTATSPTTATPPAAASADPSGLEHFNIVVTASTAYCLNFG
jgi:hypothetical protein